MAPHHESCDVGQVMGTIVVADDDAPTRRAFSRSLRHHGYHVIEAEDGGVAREIIEAAPPDAVVLDVDMPVERGDDLLARLVVSHPTLPVIIVTGDTDPALAPRVRSLGAAAFLAKPVSEEVLLEEVRRALETCSDRR